MTFSMVCRSARISSVLMVSMSDSGIHLPVNVNHVRVRERASYLADRVGLANGGEERVAQPLALRSTLDDARDVNERHRRRHEPLGVEDFRKLTQPSVGQGNHANVRLDRRERVVRREHLRAGERVEQGGLADVGQADDADSESHERQLYVGCGGRASA